MKLSFTYFGKLFLFVCIHMFFLNSNLASAQIYSSPYPVNLSIQFNGPQQRLSCSVYDSVLQSNVIYQTPYYNYNIYITGNSYNMIGFITRSSPTQIGTTMGLIVYDQLIHRFQPYYKTVNTSAITDFKTITGPVWGDFITEDPDLSGSWYVNQYMRYNPISHNWIKVAEIATHENSGLASGVGPTPNCETVIEDVNYPELYDPVTDSSYRGSIEPYMYYYDFPYEYVTDDYCSGRDYNNSNLVDRAIAFDALNHQYASAGYPFYDYQFSSGNFYGHPTNSGATTKYFLRYDESSVSFVQDSIIGHLLTNLVMKNGLITYSDTPPGGTTKYVKYRVFDPLIHHWVEDSAAVSGTLSGLSIQNSDITWNDAGGSHIRSYYPSSGWSNTSGQPFVYFTLVDYNQQLYPGIHVRNYSIGTGSYHYDFGDGIVSMNNRESMWHTYTSGGTYDVCLIDSATGTNYCQTVSVNFCGTPGYAVVSNDTICEGEIDSLSITGNSGTIKWQQQVNGTWVDETGPGADSSLYIVTPAQSSLYRAKIVDGNCMPLYTNSLLIKVWKIPVYNLTDTIMPVCTNSYHLFTIQNIGNSFTYNWQKFNLGNWVNTGTTSATLIASLIANDTTHFRVIVTSGYCFSDTSITLTCTPLPSFSAPVGVGDTTCGAGIVHLTASGSGLLSWYQTYPRKLLNYGPTFDDYISSTTSYYLYSMTGGVDSLGYTSNTIGTTDTSSINSKGIRFYLEKPAAIESFVFYPEDVGAYYFSVFNTRTKQELDQFTDTVITSGVAKKVIHSLYLEGNTSYDLKINTNYQSKAFRFNNTGINYPDYNSDSGMVILGFADTSFYTSGNFCNFYNLKFTTGCQSARTDVTGWYTPWNAYITPQTPPPICQGQYVTLSAFPHSNANYQWYRNNVLMPVTISTYVATLPGRYHVIISSAVCLDTSADVRVRMPCVFIPPPRDKIIGDETAPFLNAFYNQEYQEIILNYENLQGTKLHITLMDISGKIITEFDHETGLGNDNVEIPFGFAPPGIYLIHVIGNSENYVRKFEKY